MTALKLLAVAALIGIGVGWTFYWFAMSITTNDSGTIYPLTWRAWRVAAFGAVPVGGGVYLLFHG